MVLFMYIFGTLLFKVDDINLDVNKVQMYRFFCNKIWNASLFTINALDEGYKPLLLSEVRLKHFCLKLIF